MTDGRDIELLKIGSTIASDTVIPEVTIWRAQVIYPVHKMHSSYIHAARCFGSSPDAAIASMYAALDDAGELDDEMLPCESCGQGYRMLSLVSSYIPHKEICPAMNDTG